MTQENGVLTIGPDALRAFVELVGDLRSGVDDAHASLDASREIADGLHAKVKELDQELQTARRLVTSLRDLATESSQKIEKLLERMCSGERVSARARDADLLKKIAIALHDGARS